MQQRKFTLSAAGLKQSTYLAFRCRLLVCAELHNMRSGQKTTRTVNNQEADVFIIIQHTPNKLNIYSTGIKTSPGFQILAFT